MNTPEQKQPEEQATYTDLPKEARIGLAQFFSDIVKQRNELLQQVAAISELLAIMHGDGGHHQEKVGTLQAIKDASELLYTKWVSNEHLKDINQLSEQVKALTKENERLKEASWEKYCGLNEKIDDLENKYQSVSLELVKAGVRRNELLEQINSLTEQVEVEHKHNVILNEAKDDAIRENSRLREREKEFVEALKGLESFAKEVVLRQTHEPVFGYNGETITLTQMKTIVSLLSKFDSNKE